MKTLESAPRSGGRTGARGGGRSVVATEPRGVRVARGAGGTGGVHDAGRARGRGGGTSGGTAGIRPAPAARDGGARDAGVRDVGVRDAGDRGPRIEHPVSGSVALQPRRREPPATNASGAGTGLRVAPPAPVRAPRAPFVALVLLIVIAGVVGILVLNIKINTNAFELDQLQQQQKALDINQEQLEQEIAQREAPGTLAGQAAGLGMKPPTKPPTFILLPDDRKLDVPQPAVGKK